MAEGTSLYLPFQINLEDDFIMHQGTIQILSLIVLGSQRMLKYVYICFYFLMINIHIFSTKGAYLLHHEVNCHHKVVVHDREIQRMIFLPLNLKSAKDCISMEATYMGQQNRHAFTCGIFHITFFDPSQCKRYKANMSQYPFIYSNYLKMVSKINNMWTFFSLHYGDKKKRHHFQSLVLHTHADRLIRMGIPPGFTTPCFSWCNHRKNLPYISTNI